MAVAAAEAVIGLAIIISVFRQRQSLDPQDDAATQMVTNDSSPWRLDLLRWIPLIPLLCGVFNLFLGRALGKKTAGALACAAVGASFALAFYVFWQLPANGVFPRPGLYLDRVGLLSK